MSLSNRAHFFVYAQSWFARARTLERCAPHQARSYATSSAERARAAIWRPSPQMREFSPLLGRHLSIDERVLNGNRQLLLALATAVTRITCTLALALAIVSWAVGRVRARAGAS